MKNKQEGMLRNEPGAKEAPRKLSPGEVLKILEKFSNERINAEEHMEYFSIHLKNGNVVRIPKWKHILYANGTKKDIEDEIRDTLNREN